MRNRIVLVLLAGAVLCAVLVTVLYQGNRFLGAPSGAPRRVIVIFKTVDYRGMPFWANVRDGVLSAGKDFNLDVSIRGPSTETDIEGQIRIVRAAVEERPSAVVLAAADFALLVPLAGEIKRRGIPLVCVDSFVNSDAVDVRIGTDNYEGGQKVGAALLRYVKPGDVVAVMSYVKGSSTAIGRESGARDFLGKTVRLLDTVYNGSDAQVAYRQAVTLIARTPALRGIIALNEPTARGAAQALAESGKAGSIALIGFDNSFEVLKYVERGVIRDTVVQKPFNMGYLGVAAARELIDGRKPGRSINTGSIDISRLNMFQPENQKLLFPVTETR
jgi:ribose transport system substrate-binding protein